MIREHLRHAILDRAGGGSGRLAIQIAIADAVSVGRSTVADFERGARLPLPENLAAIRAALESAGIAFIPPNGGGPGVRLGT